MALGRTAKFYRSNAKSRQKHSDDNNSGKGGKYAHSKAYKRNHARARLQIKPGKNQDVEKQGGKWVARSAKENAADGGRKGAASNKRNNRKKK